ASQYRATMSETRIRRSVRGAGESGRDYELGSALEFMRLLWAVDHQLQSLSKQMHSKLGLTGPQRLVVRIVGRFPDVSAGALAAILHVPPSTLTGVLRRLERSGLLSRSADRSDGRRALFRLTHEGRTIDRSHSGTIEARLRAVLARQPSRRVAAARELLAEVA